MASPFNILQQSPHDLQCAPEAGPASLTASQRWIPSRYNVRATTDDGRLILWNTFSGAMSVFPPDEAPAIKELLRRSSVSIKAEGMVKYLRDRGFLVEEETNEYRRLQYAVGHQQYRTDVLELILLASEDCNFRCQYCYEQFARGTMQPSVRAGIKNLIRKRLSTMGHLRVSWFGGEPLYGFAAIEDLAPFFLETARESSISYHSAMTTNAYLLTPEVAEKLLAWGITAYQITLDGAAEDHDRNRPARDGGGTFATILENLRALKNRPEQYVVTLRVNFDRQNRPRLGELLDVIEKDFQDDPRFKLRFHAVGRWGGPNDEQLDVCGVDESTLVKRQLEEEALKRGLNIGTGLKELNKVGGEVCSAARPYNFIIGASGKIMKCTIALDTADYNVVGSLKENGDLILDKDKMALWTEPAFENDSKCQKCVVVPICQGTHCPLVRIEEHRSPCTPIRLNLKPKLIQTFKLSEERAKKVAVTRAT